MTGLVKEWYYDPMLERMQTRFRYHRQLPHETWGQYEYYLYSQESIWLSESFDCWVANEKKDFRVFGGPKFNKRRSK